MTWAGRNVERRITDAVVKKKLWVQLLVKCWTIEHGQKVVGLYSAKAMGKQPKANDC